MGYHVAVDIGGTFTDLVALDDASGELHVSKSSSQPQDPVSAVLRVIEKTGIPPSEVELFVHGTTVTTNALIERRGTRVAFVTNRGFRDVIFIQNANRRDLYSLSSWQKPRPLSSRYDCIEVGCRVDAHGLELQPLDESDVRHLIEHLETERIDSVAISFLFSFLNPAHELELARRLRAALPDLSISLSHEVYPRWRENDRGHTVVADAYLKPMFRTYIANLEAGFENVDLEARLLVMKSNGGVVEGKKAAERPVNYLVSGPVLPAEATRRRARHVRRAGGDGGAAQNAVLTERSITGKGVTMAIVDYPADFRADYPPTVLARLGGADDPAHQAPRVQSPTSSSSSSSEIRTVGGGVHRPVRGRVQGRVPAGHARVRDRVLRWGTRVASFALSLTDRYPPFTMKPMDDYPSTSSCSGRRPEPHVRRVHHRRPDPGVLGRHGSPSG